MRTDTFQWWCSAQGIAWEWSWRPYPGVWLFMAALATAYWLIVRKGRDAGAADGAKPAGRRGRVGAVGLVALWVSLDWPIGALGAGYLASVHMIQFLVMALIAPPLLLHGVSEAAYRRIPEGALGVLRWATHPLVSLPVFNLIVVGTHLPVVVDSLMGSQLGSFAIDVAWIAGGLLFWWPIAAPVPERPMFMPLFRIGYMVIQAIAMKPIFVYLTFARYPHYATYELAPLVHNISARSDQQAAGLIMETFGMIILLIAIGIIFYRWSAREDRDSLPGREEVRPGADGAVA